MQRRGSGGRETEGETGRTGREGEKQRETETNFLDKKQKLYGNLHRIELKA